MPPENTGYMVAAYVVAGIVYLGYAWSLWLRAGAGGRGRAGAGEGG